MTRGCLPDEQRSSRAAAARRAWPAAAFLCAVACLPGAGIDTESPTPALVEAALSESPSRREEALTRLAARGDPAAERLLLEALAGAPRSRAERIADALVALGATTATARIIELSRDADGAVAAVHFDAIGRLGGPQAEPYLFTVASGSPDAEGREAASRALSSLRERREAMARAEDPALGRDAR